MPQRERELKIAKRKVEILQAVVPEKLKSLTEDTKLFFQFFGNGEFPMAVALPREASKADFICAASAYSNLATKMRVLFDWTIVGSTRERRQARDGWSKYEACGIGFRVIVSWLSTLADLNHAKKKCQYCYRSRATKFRCVDHGSPINQSKGARRGHAINPIFVEKAIALASCSKVQKALGASLMVISDQWKPVLQEARSAMIPESLQRNAAILAIQLRRLRAVFGQIFEKEASVLFGQMLTSA